MSKYDEILMSLIGLGQAAIKSEDPQMEALGAAILSIPMAAADSEEDLQELYLAIFKASRERIQRNEEIEKLLSNEN